jgi:hypothetical protein
MLMAEAPEAITDVLVQIAPTKEPAG